MINTSDGLQRLTQFQRYCGKYVITVTVTDTHHHHHHHHNNTLFYLLFLQIGEYNPLQNNERKHSLNPTVLLRIWIQFRWRRRECQILSRPLSLYHFQRLLT